MKSLIIIPTYNEKENIREFIPEILKLNLGFDVLIVDDNSPDGTSKTVRSLSKDYSEVSLIHRKAKMGIASAYIDGFKYALKKDYDLIFQMDGDFSHRPEFLPDFFKKIENYDLVIGSRYCGGGIRIINWDFKRILLSNLANKYAKIITGVPVSDNTAGFKCFKRKVLENIDLDEIRSQGYSFQIEMNWRVYRAGFKIAEIPIVFHERKYGQSKLSANIIREGLWLLWKIRLKS